METGTSKAEIRSLLLTQRKNMTEFDVQEKSKAIVNNILGTDEYRNTKCIYAYISTRNEVELKELIENAWIKGKRVAVPRVCGQNMDFYYIRSYDDLAKGSFGIMEPSDYAPKADDKDALMLIPGVAYDLSGNRIGYGGGYYDRYLAKANNHFIIAPAYEFQVFDKLEAQEHDIRVGRIITESVEM